MLHRIKGFSLVELIIVIVLLGVLAATALPRFVDFRMDANEAKHQQLVATLQTAIDLAHTRWQLSGQPSSADVGGTTVYFNSAGYPENISEAADNIVSFDDCVDLWLTLVPNYPNPQMRTFSLDDCGPDAAVCPMYGFSTMDDSNNYIYCRYRTLTNGTAYNNVSPWYNDILYNTQTGEVQCLRSLQTTNNIPSGFTDCHWNEPLAVP